MGGNQQPTMPPAAPPTPPPAAPNPMATMLAGLSQGELAILAGSAAITALDVILWVVSGYSFSHVIVAGAATAVALILLRSRLPAALAGSYQMLVLLIALVVVLMGVRNLALDLLSLGRASGFGLQPMYLLGMLVVAGGSVAIAYGALLLWRGR